MPYIPPVLGYCLLTFFGVVMTAITYLFARKTKTQTKNTFLVADRNIGWFTGGVSIAASWLWAPALFVSVQLAYEKGLPGIFWFATPNILALALFSILAPKIRAAMPEGYTLPQYIKTKLKSDRVHKIYLVPYLFYQIMAVTVQLYAGGNLIALLSGIPLTIVMPILAIITLAYTLISGLKASIITDFLQIALIFIIGAIILPLTWSAGGGITAITAGLGGLANITNIFDPGTAFSLGIVTSIGLLAGAISDQQYWQRTFAIKKTDLKKSFIFGALLFGIIPIALSTLGFMAANPGLDIVLPAGIDASMIGVQTVATLLPNWATVLFIIMLLAGLSSTLDSGLAAASSLYVTDIVKQSDDKQAIKSARISMVGTMILGLLIAYAVVIIPQLGLFHLWWIFNTIAATVVIPTVLSLYWKRLSAKGVFYGVLTSFVIGLPLFIYGNVTEQPLLTVGASLFIIIISTAFCLFMPQKEY